MVWIWTYKDEVGVAVIQSITFLDLVHDGGLAVGGRGGSLVGDVDAEDGNVEEVVHQVHSAIWTGTRRAVNRARGECIVGHTLREVR